MAKAPPIEQQLLELSGFRADAKSAAARERFTKALSGKNNLLAARAATIVTETQQPDFLPLLVTAFNRFFEAGSDKGCSAKTAIGNALYALGHSDSAEFLRGIRHVQMEAVWGGRSDTAAELRGICGVGLVRIGYRDALLEVSGLLMDAEAQTRQMAVRAVVYSEQDAGAMLLRMKVMAGDQNLDVMAEALAGLMKLSPSKSLEFVERFLGDANQATVESAAIAIGGARSMPSFEMLRRHWEQQILAEQRSALLLGIAMTRQPAAIDFLLERIEEDSAKPAADAVNAMAMYKHDEAVRGRIAAAVQARDDLVITEAFTKAFDSA